MTYKLSFICHVYKEISDFIIKLALPGWIYSITILVVTDEKRIELAKNAYDYVSLAGRVINSYFTRDRRSVAGSWLANCKYEWSRMGKRSPVPRLVVTRIDYYYERYIQFRVIRARSGRKDARERGYYRANYGTGSIHLREVDEQSVVNC